MDCIVHLIILSTTPLCAELCGESKNRKLEEQRERVTGHLSVRTLCVEFKININI